MLYWQIGHRVNQDVLKNERAAYGEEVIIQLAQQFKEQYGSGFDKYNLSRMVRFAKIYSEPQIVVTLSQQLSWSHFLKLIIIDDSLKRDFYTEMCRLQGWGGVRALREKIDSMLYERTAIAKQPEPIIRAELEKLKQGNLTNPDLYLQDPCVLKLLYPHQITSERKMEDAILNDLQIFIQDMGSDFCFIARQKRMSTEKNDRFLDLLLLFLPNLNSDSIFLFGCHVVSLTTNAKGLKKALEEAVDDYLETCRKQKMKPEVPFKGSLNVRLGPELHRRIAIVAQQQHLSINKFIAEKLNQVIGE